MNKRTIIIGLIIGLMVSFIPKRKTYHFTVEINRSPIVSVKTLEETPESDN